jgi:hypothetical protein
MPEAGVALQPTDNLLTSHEIGKVAELFVAAGVDKVRLPYISLRITDVSTLSLHALLKYTYEPL